MRKYRENADTPQRVDYGTELTVGLNIFPETAPMAPIVGNLTTDLEKSWFDRLKLHRPVVESRVGVRLGNWLVDGTIRGFQKACIIVDGGIAGVLTKGIFTEGLAGLVAPGGKRQIKPTEDLIDRVTKSKLPGIDKVRGEWLPKLQENLGQLKAAAAAHDAALLAEVGAFRTEVSLREDHYLTIDKIIGLVRAAFPGDRTRQDVIFPEVATSDHGVDDAPPAGGGTAPTTGPTPGT